MVYKYKMNWANDQLHCKFDARENQLRAVSYEPRAKSLSPGFLCRRHLSFVARVGGIGNSALDAAH